MIESMLYIIALVQSYVAAMGPVLLQAINVSSIITLVVSLIPLFIIVAIIRKLRQV